MYYLVFLFHLQILKYFIKGLRHLVRGFKNDLSKVEGFLSEEIDFVQMYKNIIEKNETKIFFV